MRVRIGRGKIRQRRVSFGNCAHYLAAGFERLASEMEFARFVEPPKVNRGEARMGIVAYMAPAKH